MAAGRRVVVNPIFSLSSEVLEPAFPLSGCGACRGSYSVRPDGALFSCYTFLDNEDYRIGDVFGGFDQQSLMRERRKFFWDSPVCGKCPMRYNCAGGCFNDMARIDGHNIERFPVLSCIARAEHLKRAAYLVKNAPPEFVEWVAGSKREKAETSGDTRAKTGQTGHRPHESDPQGIPIIQTE
ncbi:SPASM domain-containing protein [bacterium]|nr:SPASM domain-containing protein [bacterium]